MKLCRTSATLSVAAVFLSAVMVCHAQQVEQFRAMSNIVPQAESYQIAVSGNLMPSQYTGAMSMSLPLYEYKDPDFDIPVSLEYSYDGCRVFRSAGTVGLGWSLNCGGVITREVRGLKDEYESDPDDEGSCRYGYWHVYRDRVGIGNEFTKSRPDTPDFFGIDSELTRHLNADLYEDVPVRENGEIVGFEDRRFVKDRLGSVRAVLGIPMTGGTASGSQNVSLLEETMYTPYGEVYRESSMPVLPDSRWRYAGKEEQEFAGLEHLDFGARLYHPEVGRWTSPDPLAAKYISVSPYVYCNGDPVNVTDPDGKRLDEYDKNGRKISEFGEDVIDFYHMKNTKDEDIILAVNRANGVRVEIKDSDLFSHAVLRLSNMSWKDVFDEFINGTGPAHSLFMDLDESKVGPFKSFLSEKSIYGKALRNAYVEGKPKSSVAIWYDKINPITAGFDMWEQMIGRANLSWYDLGDRFMYIIQDTKSN